MGLCNMNFGVFGLFSEYPLTRNFKDPRIPMTVTILSALLLVGLITFNVLTQGSVSQTESVLRGHWFKKNSTLSCQPATMVMGNTYFTNAPPRHLADKSGAVELEAEDAGGKRGSFSWALQSVVRGHEGLDTAETGFYYQESPLRCNITGISLTYDFQIQSFSYSMRAMCVTPSVEENTPDNYLSLETRFSILDKAVPRFTEEVQNILQAQIFGISKYYPELNLSANALPSSAFPPYHEENNRLAEEEVGNRDILQWSVWLDGFNYTLTEDYRDFNHSHLYMQPLPQGRLFVGGKEGGPRSLEQGTLDLLNAGRSGLQIAAVGIGGIRPIPRNASLPDVLLLPAPLPLYLNLTESILAIMMDMAGKDLNKRVLGTGYLCTITKNPWKKAFPMLAMIIGSCSGMLGAAVTIMLFLARRYDSHLISKHKKARLCESALSHTRLIAAERAELILESQLSLDTEERPDKQPDS